MTSRSRPRARSFLFSAAENRSQNPHPENRRDAAPGKVIRALGQSPPGLAMPIVLVALLPITWWSIRDSESSKAGQVIFALSVSAMLWACIAIFQVCRRGRKLGLNRSNLGRFLSDGRPSDPEELLLWQWVLQVCYATAAFVVCMVALTLTS